MIATESSVNRKASFSPCPGFGAHRRRSETEQETKDQGNEQSSALRKGDSLPPKVAYIDYLKRCEAEALTFND
jgi:hypothetical protein